MANSTTDIPVSFDTVLDRKNWISLKERHEQRIGELIDDYLNARQHHVKQPVMDFLFEYYAFRPSHLRRWSPGFGILLEDGDKGQIDFDEMSHTPEGSFMDPKRFDNHRIDSLQWVLGMLENSRDNRPMFGCCGMHEWAMVYRAREIRHDDFPLRMNMNEIAGLVESRPLQCTHFDAFRFFTDQAKPMNRHELTRDNFDKMEQGGCLHTNMDLYKWAFKYYPWTSSELIREAFELALEARRIDMKASPYDLRERGLEPIRIETEQGRKEYIECQEEIYRKSKPIRDKLINHYQMLLEHVE